MKTVKEKFNRLSRTKKIVVGVIAVGIMGNILGFNDEEEPKAIEPVQTVQKVEAEPVKEVIAEPKPVEVEEVEPTYEIRKNYIENDSSAYSGRSVYEIEVFAEFDLEAKDIKSEVMDILHKEALIGLKEKPNSVMVRVFAYQGSVDNFEILPVATTTFDIIDDSLVLRPLQDKARFPIFNKQ